jgi:RHS repeat-associated protein
MTNNANVPNTAKLTLSFIYDYLGRRFGKTVSNFNGSAYQIALSNPFVYDSWNLVDELNATNNGVIRAYLWGEDLSGQAGGALSGAGGVGGLLAVLEPSSAQFTRFDGNGNIMALVDTSGSGITGQYEYGPFGEVIRATGPMAKTNPFHFSTKYQDDESDLLYYPHRYLNVSIGRWLGRDPIGEQGGRALYAFVHNDGIDFFDALGLCGSYTKCDGQWKTVNVSAVIMDGAMPLVARGVIDDVKRANEIYAQCCVKINLSAFIEVGPAKTAELIGSDEMLDIGGGGMPSNEEIALTSYKPEGNNVTHAYYVKDSVNFGYTGTLRGTSYPDWIPSYVPLYPAFVFFNEKAEDTFAHELGHVLGLMHVGDINNLMAPGSIRNFKDLLYDGQCNKIRGSKLAK